MKDTDLCEFGLNFQKLKFVILKKTLPFQLIFSTLTSSKFFKDTKLSYPIIFKICSLALKKFVPLQHFTVFPRFLNV